MTNLRDRFDTALSELLSRGQNSAIYEQMSEASNDDEFCAWVSFHFQRMQQITTAQEVDQTSESTENFLAALARGQDRALSALLRLAFEAGRLDERNEATSLNDLLAGMED